MPFKSGLTSTNSKPGFILAGGVGSSQVLSTIGLDARAVDGYNPVFRTKLIENGKTEDGKQLYKTELIKYNSKKDASSFTGGTVIATGSTKPGEKNFEFNDNAGEIDKKFKKEIFAVQKSQVKEIIRNEKTGNDSRGRDKGNQQLNKDLQTLGANKPQENPVESVNTPIPSKTSIENRQGIGRKNYGNLFYPTFIQNSQQDKLKITVLKAATRFLETKKAERQKNLTGGQGARENKKSNKNRRTNKNNYVNDKAVKLSKAQQKAADIINSTSTLDNRKRPEFGKRILGSITLPIPNGVTDQNKVNFGAGSLNPFQVAVAQGALKTLLDGLGAGADQAAETFSESAKNSSLKPALANLLTASIIGVDNNELLARGTGNIINNNLELLFKGPTLRPFTFQFNLSPRDVDESIQVQKIIRCFKQSSAVQRTPGGIFLASPNTYRLEFKNGTSPHKFLPKIKECALLAVSVNYMPENSYMTYENSSMVAYTVNLSFQELEPIFNNDYDDLDQDFFGVSGVGESGIPLAPSIASALPDASGIGF